MSATLMLAVSGCCTGHRCDDCARCRDGRCCRKDNPEYQLPNLGDWDGPLYGDLGRLNDDGDRIECHVCGSWHKALPKHIGSMHDLTAREYKRLFGLTLTTGLVSSQTSANLARTGHEWFSNPDDPRCQRMREAREAGQLTPEQQSAVALASHAYDVERRKTLGLPLSPVGLFRESRLAERACSVCGRSFRDNWKPSHHALKTCSEACSMQRRRYGQRLTRQDADTIRRLYASGGVSHRQLGRAFNVKRQTIYQILKGIIYRSEDAVS